MAVTVNLADFYPPVTAGAGFYAHVMYDAQGTYWDETAQTLLPIANVTTPNIPFVEDPPGTWAWVRNFNALPDGFYTVMLYGNDDLKAAPDHRIFLKSGLDVTVLEKQEIAINENTGGADALRYTGANGEAIGGATIRVYTQADWQAQSLAAPVGITFTTATGRWADPIFVPTGSSYVVQFHLANAYGPDTVTVTV